ncbi:hypothetical protein T439DRAFT_359932 [Meredithblackwellia eburnea MCA 4105]
MSMLETMIKLDTSSCHPAFTVNLIGLVQRHPAHIEPSSLPLDDSQAPTFPIPSSSWFCFDALFKVVFFGQLLRSDVRWLSEDFSGLKFERNAELLQAEKE